MRTDNGLKHYASKADYINRESSPLPKKVGGDAVAAKDVGPAVKSDLSSEAKELSSENTLKEAPKAALKAAVSESGSALTHLAGEASEVLAVGLKQLGPGLPIKGAPEIKSDAPKMSQIYRPAIFFIEGFSLFSGSSGGGLPDLQKNMPGSELYAWDDEDKMLEEILKRPLDRPVVLVGHSLGGDAAVNLANRLNTLENGYRKIDLIVTLDSVGFKNDIIPANVKKNLNFIGDEDAFFNDGPNIARDNRYTEVINELRSEGHRQIDEAEDIHFKIFNSIGEVLGPDLARRMLENNRVRAISTVNSSLRDRL